MSRRAYLWAWIIVSIMIAYGSLVGCKQKGKGVQLPWPPRFIAAAIAFGLLDVFAIFEEDLAGVIAIGIVIAAIVSGGFQTNCNHQGTGQTDAQTLAYFSQEPQQNTLTPGTSQPQSGTTQPPGTTTL